MATGHIIIDIEKMPEIIHAMRVRMAELLREQAASESDPRVSIRLLETAAQFEAGQ